MNCLLSTNLLHTMYKKGLQQNPMFPMVNNINMLSDIKVKVVNFISTRRVRTTHKVNKKRYIQH